MKLFKSIIILLTIIYSFGTLEFEVFASSSVWVSDLESQITPDSSENTIIKLQKLFFGLWLYKWSIDWNYKSIEKTLIDYQINSWLVDNPWDWGAWYFGKKTIIQLKFIYITVSIFINQSEHKTEHVLEHDFKIVIFQVIDCQVVNASWNFS